MAGPGGAERGRISIRVLPDTSRFAVSTQRFLDRVERRVELRVPITPDTSRFTAQVRAGLARTRARVEVPVVPDTRLFQERLRAAVRGPLARVQVPVVPDLRRFEASLRSHLRQVRVPVVPDLDARALVRLRAELAGIRPVVIPARVDVDRGVMRDMSRSLAELGSAGADAARGLVSAAASAGRFAAVVGTAVPVAAGLSAALAEMAPAAALAAPAVLSLGLAGGAAAVAFRGFGDALKGEEGALAKLTPAAQAAVRALRGFRPELGEIRKAVQERLFKGLADDITRAGTVALPVFKTALTGASGALNTMLGGVLKTAQSLAENGTMGQALASANTGLRNLSGLPALVVQGLFQIGAAAGPAFEELTKQAGEAMTRLSKRMTTAFKSGEMQRAIEDAVALVRQLGRIAGNVGGIVQEVFSAANITGGGFLGTLEKITGSIRQAFASPEVQAGLEALFSTMAKLASTVGPLLGDALRIVGQVLAKLGPPVQKLIGVLGDALAPVIDALGPVLVKMAEAVGRIVVAAAPLLPVLSDLIVTALKPMQPIIAKIGDIFARLAPVIAQLAPVIAGALLPVLTGLAEVAVELVTQFGDQLLAILPQLAQMAIQLAPVFLEVGRAVGEVLKAAAPLLPQLTGLAVMIFSQLLPAILPLIPPLATLAVAFIRLATDVLTGVVMPVLRGLMTFLAGTRAMMQPFIDAATVVTEAVASAFRWLYNLLVGNSIVPDLVNGIVSWFGQLPSRVLSAVASLPGKLGSKMRDAGARMLSAAKNKGGELVDWMVTLPRRAANALGDLGSLLYGAGTALIQGLVDGIRSMAGAVESAVGGVLSAAKNLLPSSPAKEGPFSGRGWTLYSGRSISEALAAGMLDRQRQVRAAALQVVGAAQGNLSGLQPAVAGASAHGGDGLFTGDLYLDSGEFLGAVRGVLRDENRQMVTTLRAGRRGP